MRFKAQVILNGKALNLIIKIYTKKWLKAYLSGNLTWKFNLYPWKHGRKHQNLSDFHPTKEKKKKKVTTRLYYVAIF